MEQKGPRHAPHPWSQSMGDLTWEPSRLPGLKWAGQMPSSPLLLLWFQRPLLPASPVLPSASFLCPQDQCGGGWGLGGQGTSLGAQQAPWAQVAGANTLHSSPAPPRWPLPPASPDLPSLRGTDPVWPPLLPFQSPRFLLVHLGVPPISLGIRVPHQWPAVALVEGRC